MEVEWKSQFLVRGRIRPVMFHRLHSRAPAWQSGPSLFGRTGFGEAGSRNRRRRPVPNNTKQNSVSMREPRYGWPAHALLHWSTLLERFDRVWSRWDLTTVPKKLHRRGLAGPRVLKHPPPGSESREASRDRPGLSVEVHGNTFANVSQPG